jgi:hypothetical protein
MAVRDTGARLASAHDEQQHDRALSRSVTCNPIEAPDLGGPEAGLSGRSGFGPKRRLARKACPTSGMQSGLNSIRDNTHGCIPLPAGKGGSHA